MTPNWHPSPNFGARREGRSVDLVVLHYTAMASAEEALARLCDPKAEVSAHYLISRTGAVYNLVAEEKRAWHAGAGQWGQCRDVNSSSVGIELDNDGQTPFSAPLMLALEQLLQAVMARHDVGPERVIAHSDMAPTRKFDPGPRFDWRRLALQGLSVWPDHRAAPTPDPARFLNTARRFGYPDQGFEAVLSAFRHRFCPWQSGPLEARDMALITDLAHRFPVDGSLQTA